MKERNLNILNKVGFVLNKPSPGLPWVLRVALEHWGRKFHHARAAADNIFLAYVQNGVLIVDKDDERIEVGPGSVFYHAQEEGRRVMTVSPDRGLRVAIIVVRGGIGLELARKCLGKTTRQMSLGDSSAIESLFLCMHKAASKGYSNSSDIVANLFLPTIQTLRQEEMVFGETTDSNQRLFNRCREFINHNYLGVSSVKGVAHRFGISHAWLCRLFKQYEDCPPHHFLLQRKMTHALYELQQRNRSVGDIGDELGFADPYSFSKSFKRIMGFSPSQARSGKEAPVISDR